MKLYPLTVVDDFYDNPDDVRQFALDQEYFTNSNNNHEVVSYPGTRTKPLHEINPKLFDVFSRKLFSIFHNFQKENINWVISTYFQSLTEEYESGWIHHDGIILLAGVVYLTPNAPLSSGTTMYRKKPDFDETLFNECNLKKEDNWHNGIVTGETEIRETANSMFEETLNIGNMYNRMLLMPSGDWHAAKNYFGKDLQTSRLTQVFFVEQVASESFPLLRMKA